ncbi:hypothetical protein [Desulfoscipio gibsoniae]|uniref:Uncharacterized protein n=1 Tax=Desulfoscipio gibsoniae DSM 7213 TaxID=767817 RepID=R4KJG2_9FIRM|nr:hypothetical protein [Desulfoscipio gibsoniae]AGL02764.1 hypothetical protein Desgi_3421 [Desulfoscipio gibsoniae DSM 7213]
MGENKDQNLNQLSECQENETDFLPNEYQINQSRVIVKWVGVTVDLPTPLPNDIRFITNWTIDGNPRPSITLQNVTESGTVPINTVIYDGNVGIMGNVITFTANVLTDIPSLSLQGTAAMPQQRLSCPQPDPISISLTTEGGPVNTTYEFEIILGS